MVKVLILNFLINWNQDSVEKMFFFLFFILRDSWNDLERNSPFQIFRDWGKRTKVIEAEKEYANPLK